MFVICKLRADHVLDFAAEELKKYLRMMMPRCGEIDIRYDPAAKEGFRLGLLEDFSLDRQVDDPVLDDYVFIDTDLDGGILAGSNPRSVLFAVYRYLRLNGCRWLYPGVDGEHIPITQILPQKYEKLADHRFRGHCNEGAESQTCMLETIDFFAKQELNVYMMEFDIPYAYYNDYYSHDFNAANRPPEPVSYDQVLQWKRQCEAEISKRGLQFHDMGHGWTAEPFGLNSADGWLANDSVVLTPEQKEYLALTKGSRRLWGGVTLNTNLCMSNPKVRTIMAQYIADYAQNAGNVDYLHVWLADGSRNHCECEECQKMRPSDYYLMIMNELDDILTQRGLDTRVVFICYVDTLFAPEQVTIRNPKRFSLLYAPIHRSYTSSVNENAQLPEALPYVRNKWDNPPTADAHLALLRKWQQVWPGPTFSYEYHFWRHQYADPSGLAIARRIYEDIRTLRYMGLDGYVEDGSQRSFFPNGFAMYVYAETLLDRERSFEDIAEDYFSHIYGPDWQQVVDYLTRVGQSIDFAYMEAERSADPEKGKYYNPDMVSRLACAKELAREAEALANAHLTMPTRPQTVSYRLLLRHGEYIEGLAEVMTAMARGEKEEALELAKKFYQSFGRHEFEIERYFDHMLACRCLHLRVAGTVRAPQEGM